MDFFVKQLFSYKVKYYNILSSTSLNVMNVVHSVFASKFRASYCIDWFGVTVIKKEWFGVTVIKKEWFGVTVIKKE